MSYLRFMAVAFAIAVPEYIIVGSAAAQTPNYATNGDPTLAALINEALRGNPRVRGAFHEYQAAQSRVPQAASLPNPTLSFTQHVRGPETRVGPQSSSVSLSQALPWFGMLSDRREIAAARVGNPERVLRGAKGLKSSARSKLAYYDLAYLDRAPPDHRRGRAASHPLRGPGPGPLFAGLRPAAGGRQAPGGGDSRPEPAAGASRSANRLRGRAERVGQPACRYPDRTGRDR